MSGIYIYMYISLIKYELFQTSKNELVYTTAIAVHSARHTGITVVPACMYLHRPCIRVYMSGMSVHVCMCTYAYSHAYDSMYVYVYVFMCRYPYACSTVHAYDA